ncbi:MAG: prolyl oligopeptidase family serine peptidase, partial [Williamsia herbipolensis]|nr:prolyl oligopeptidase family serine peptidase [Williamsia herbipolensis]
TDDVDHRIYEQELAVQVYDRPETTVLRSPIARAGRVSTPTLLLHAEFDHRCPIGQSEEWFSALRRHGVPSTLVRYPGVSHQFLVDGPPSFRLDYNRRIVDWAQRWTAAQ